MRKNILEHSLLSLGTVLLLSMVGCSENTTDSSSEIGTENGTGGSDTSIISSTISGKAIDGYLSGSRVCLDVIADNNCTRGEPQTTTNAKGEFSLTITAEDKVKYPLYKDASLLVYGGTDIDTNSTFSGKLKAPLKDATSVNISPISTAVQVFMENNATQVEAEKSVRKLLNLPDNTDLKGDPIALADTNATLLKVSLQLHKSLEVLAKTKSAGTTTLSLYKDIAEKNTNSLKTYVSTSSEAKKIYDDIDTIISGTVSDTAIVGKTIDDIKVKLDENIDNNITFDINTFKPQFKDSNTTAKASVFENQKVAITLDANTSYVTYVLGGADADLFSVDNTTGVISFKTAPDYELIDPSAPDNNYTFTVGLQKGASISDINKTVSITVVDVDERGPQFTSDANITVNEKQTTVITLRAAGAISFELSGADKDLFNVDSRGKLTFKTAQSYTTAKHSYALTVTAKDSSGFENSQNLVITLKDITAPEFTSPSTVTATKDSTAAITLVATDGGVVTYAISDKNASAFTINPSTGVVTFNTAPTNADATYEFTATATDDSNNSATQSVTITTTYIDMTAPAFTFVPAKSVNENQTSAITLTSDDTNATYSISGGDSSLFNIDAKTGVVTFKTAPNYESKKSYTFEATATDAVGNANTQTVTITILNVNEAPTIAAIENVIAIQNTAITPINVTASDVDANTTLSYSATGLLTGVIIDSDTGVISGIPSVAGDQSVSVTVSDGNLSATTSFDMNVSVDPDITVTADSYGAYWDKNSNHTFDSSDVAINSIIWEKPAKTDSYTYSVKILSNAINETTLNKAATAVTSLSTICFSSSSAIVLSGTDYSSCTVVIKLDNDFASGSYKIVENATGNMLSTYTK